MSTESKRFDPAIQTEDIGFSPEELVACGVCGRKNSPERSDCLYCGAGLSGNSLTAKHAIRRLEQWDPGVSLILTGSGDVAEAARLLDIEAEQLSSIIGAGVPLPVARSDERSIAGLVEELSKAGFEPRAVSDDELAISRPQTRLSALVLDASGVTATDFNTRERYSHTWEEIVLIVVGLLTSGKIDAIEKRRRKNTSVLSESVTSNDEPVIDLYAADSMVGYRINLSGFDFSTLGDDMSQLATENIIRLADALKQKATQAKFVDDYRSVRHLLTGIWDLETRKDPQGLQQIGFGKREFGVVHSTNNADQLTRFSRLQRVML